MVQARFNPNGYNLFLYMYTSTNVSICNGHGPDDPPDDGRKSALVAIQRLDFANEGGTPQTDFGRDTLRLRLLLNWVSTNESL
jgi:hypothetical protein